MKRDASGPALSAVYVDYDNIYLSLKRKNEDAAKRFSKDAALWLRELESGALITATSGFGTPGPRRIVLNRCYGNPVPRRNSHDNSTDMNSFPFIRHHFLRAGAEVVDCPPLTAQLKNSADIRIVMDVRDMITHDTYFDEFVILSSDADFTPLLHRLRSHARRTVIYANDQTASPYTAISDGEIREADLLRLLLDGRGTDRAITAEGAQAQLPQPGADHSALRRELAAEAATLVRSAGQPVPMEALADRLVRQFGHDRTAGSGWAGMGSFRDLLASYLPEGLKISEHPPFVVLDIARLAHPDRAEPEATQAPIAPRNAPLPQPAASAPTGIPAPVTAGPHTSPQPVEPQTQLQPSLQARPHGRGDMPPAAAQPTAMPPAAAPAPQRPVARPAVGVEQGRVHSQPHHLTEGAGPPHPVRAPLAQPPAGPPPEQRSPSASAAAVQQMVARIYDACQAPPLSPPEYRLVFSVMAEELSARGLNGTPTLDAIAAGAKSHGVNLRRDDVRFILDVVSEPDPWFEQGVSSNLFASRFRNFVVARCRSQGLALSAEEIDLIDHWFAGAEARPPQQQIAQRQPPQPQLPAPGTGNGAAATGPAGAGHAVAHQSAHQGDTWWSTGIQSGQAGTAPEAADDFPRIIRSRLRG